MPADRAPPPRGALAGRAILVTRPQHQAQALVRLIEERGARALRFPLLRIVALADSRAALERLARLERGDVAVFVSANAVHESARVAGDLAARLKGVKVAAIGDATRRALEATGLEAEVMTAAGSTSEALLALPAFSAAAIAGRRVAIVKGRGGRDLLERALGARGACVELLEVYERIGPDGDFDAFLDRHGAEVDAAIVTSAEALEHLLRIAPRAWRKRVQAWPLALASERVARRARELGFVGPMAAPRRMADGALVDAVEAALAERGPASTTIPGRGAPR